MKKVLIITYYWPPSGGGGVMRWLKMSKYLPEFGWKPIIYTPANPDASVVDESLVDEVHPDTEVIKMPIWEPYNLFRVLTGKKKSAKFKPGFISEASTGDWKSKLSVFIRGNLLIPDPRRFWIKPSVRFLSEYLKKNPVDLIISTGPPHSMHLIGMGLRQKVIIPWIADFRDPWTDIDFYSKLRLTKWADKIHHNLERKVIENADHVVTVSPNCAASLTAIPGKPIHVIHNGYDPQDFKDLHPTDDEKFTLCHFGSFNSDRNPKALWKVLGSLSSENSKFREKLVIKLIGQTDDSIITDIRNSNLTDNLITIDHLPHKAGLQELANANVLLLAINDTPNAKGIIPGKMYEYIALKRIILAIGPTDSDFAKIILETKAGRTINFGDTENMRKAIEEYFNLFLNNQLAVNSDSADEYSRRYLAEKFIKLTNT